MHVSPSSHSPITTPQSLVSDVSHQYENCYIKVELALLYGELRKTHLQAHLQINPLLSTEQIKKYNQIRGYEIVK